MKTVQRTFMPGSKCVYLKIYTGVKTADGILTRDISSIITNLYKNNWIEKWFFIRYADPDFHLRIRVFVTEGTYSGEVIHSFHNRLKRLEKAGLIWKIQLDTYNRELERYGNNLMKEAETRFYIDSECAIKKMKKLNEKEESYRWMIALYAIDQLLSDFSVDIATKQQWMERLSLAFRAEFGFDMYNSKQFNVKYREHKATIEKVLNNRIESDDFNALRLPVQKRSEKLQPLISQIQFKLSKKKIPDISLESLLSSYIHMLLNRLFRSKNRQHEMVLYDFLNRYYKSEIAKGKYGHS
jgi:thiopeptide-type bacteriocin biosynthesis protein